MRVSVAIVLAFVALVSACYVPFNDVRFTNATFASEFFAAVKNDAGQGWASIVVNNSPVKPWPLVPAPPTDVPGDEGLVTIPYCYRTAEDRIALQEVIEGGIKIWSDSLPKPSQAPELDSLVSASTAGMARFLPAGTRIPTSGTLLYFMAP